MKQECIPVGCVPIAAVAVTGGLHTPQSRHPPSRHPPRAGSPPPPGAGTLPARSPSTSPLGVGLDQIPLNFPPGCGPEPDPLQQGMLGYPQPPKTCCKACWDTTCNACWDSTHTTPPPRRQTHTCKNITFVNYVCGR